MVDELEQFKKMDLSGFMEGYGYRMDVKKSGKTDGSDKVMRREGDDDKLLVKERADGWVWCSCRDWNERGNIIDFVRREHGCGFVEAIQRLRGDAGALNPSSFHTSRSKAITAPATEQDEGYRKKALAVWNAAVWNSEPDYLLSRGLHPATLADPRFKDCWRVDRKGNVIFPHHDRIGLCGYELRNHGFKSFGAGTRKALWHSRNLKAATSIVLCESSIDCLSHFQIHQENAAYVSIGGTPSALQRDLLTGLLLKAHRRGATVYAAFDNDPKGDEYSEIIQLLSPAIIERMTPVSGDWNDDLMEVLREAA